MTKNEQIKELETKLNNIKKEIDSLKSEKFPQLGDTYYFREPLNRVSDAIYEDDSFDRCAQKVGNFFQTKKEAQKELDKRILLQEMKEFADYQPVWDGDIRNYLICYGIVNKHFTVTSYRYVNDLTPFYFSTELRAQEAIEHFGDRLKLLI